MTENKTYLHKSRLLVACLTLLATSASLTFAAEAKNTKRLKIVFLMGQSNMVGYSNPETAWYLTQPVYVPPAKTATVHGPYFKWDEFYWLGLRFATGSKEYVAKGKALLEERTAFRTLWRSRYYGNFSRGAKTNNWNYKAWGQPPKSSGKVLRDYMQIKADEAGLYKRMAAYIESPENKLHPTVAIKLIAKRDEPIAEDLKRVREIFLKGTKPEDFDRLDEALKSFGSVTVSNRTAYAELVREYVHLPIAKRTYISAFGEVAGSPAQGLLSLGYTKWPTACGPEYPFGISFEQMVDGPVLLIKCAVGGTSLSGDWRPPSLKNGPGPLWTKALTHIKSVLADPGKYHPDYDPKAGYELAGSVWFQGWNDMGNTEYGEQLVTFIKDFRKEVKAPDLPVICGLLGHVGWEMNTFDGNVNSGMLYASKHPDLKGTVDIVNTVKYMPIELDLRKSIEVACGAESDEYKKADKIISRASSKDGTHYFGSAKFVYLTGDAMARTLANLMGGGEPTIFAEEAEILGGE